MSAILQLESATGTLVSPSSRAAFPPLTPSHPSSLSQSPGFELAESHRKFPLAIYFTYGDLYVFMLPSQFVPPSPFPLEKAMAPHSGALAWKIPWTEEPGRSCGPWGR